MGQCFVLSCYERWLIKVLIRLPQAQRGTRNGLIFSGKNGRVYCFLWRCQNRLHIRRQICVLVDRGLQKRQVKTALTSNHELVQLVRMPFGLKNELATFRRAINVVLYSVK